MSGIAETASWRRSVRGSEMKLMDGLWGEEKCGMRFRDGLWGEKCDMRFRDGLWGEEMATGL